MVVDIDFTVLHLCNTIKSVLRWIFLFSELITTLTDSLKIWCTVVDSDTDAVCHYLLWATPRFPVFL